MTEELIIQEVNFYNNIQGNSYNSDNELDMDNEDDSEDLISEDEEDEDDEDEDEHHMLTEKSSDTGLSTHDDFINEEEDTLGAAYAHSLKLINPQVTKKIIVPDIQEEFTLAPFEPGFGLTIGNALRRIILSHMTGFAISAVQISGCTHQFQQISGIRDNVGDILANFKQVSIKVDNSCPLTSFFATVEKKGPGDVLAKDIVMENGVVCNPEQFICSLDTDGHFKAKILICLGRGYVKAHNNKFINTCKEESEFIESAIFIDSTYNHIKKIEYMVEPTRVEEKTDYDKLILKIETTGAISPKDCLGRAYQLLWHQMSPIKNFDSFDIQMEEQEKETNKSSIPEIMFIPVTKIGLSTRVRNGLEVNNIEYIGDLVTKNEHELTRSPRIGKESIREIKSILSNLNFDLSLGMTVKGWRPPNVDKISATIVKEELIEG